MQLLGERYGRIECLCAVWWGKYGYNFTSFSDDLSNANFIDAGKSTILFDGTTDDITDVWDNVIDAEVVRVSNLENDDVTTVACRYCVVL